MAGKSLSEDPLVNKKSPSLLKKSGGGTMSENRKTRIRPESQGKKASHEGSVEKTKTKMMIENENENEKERVGEEGKKKVRHKDREKEEEGKRKEKKQEKRQKGAGGKPSESTWTNDVKISTQSHKEILEYEKSSISSD
eukprot:748828-Hanusia_phi.AAC.3